MDKKKGLRSRLAQYGDEEFALFLRRGFLKGAGFTDEALDKPIVGILSTASDFNPCHKTAPQVAEAISRGVRAAGALPFVFPTVSLHEAFSFPTSMLLRNLMAMDVEEMVKALPLDAVVLIGGCDKTIPAELMGAISADMPAIVINVGSMLAGKHEGARLGACTDCRRLWAQFRAGTLDGPDLGRAHDQLMPTSGTCMVMGTASTMTSIAEVLGFTLPGAASIPAADSNHARMASYSGRRIVEMAWEDLKPSDFLTAKSFDNAIITAQALSGSTNALIHLIAMAGRAGVKLELERFDEIARNTPVLANIRPAGQKYLMEDFCYAGGLPAVMKEILPHLHGQAMTVSGHTVADNVAKAQNFNPEVIKTVDQPFKDKAGIAVLRGNLAPRGAVIKPSAATPELMKHTGRAVVFEDSDDFHRRIDDESLDVAAE